MKKYLIIAFAAIASFTACDFLDRGPLSDMTEEIYFRTAEDFQLFTNPLYNNLLDKHPYNHQSDHYIRLSLSNLLHGGSYRTVPESGGGWTWTDLRRINTVLSRMDTCEDEKVRAEYEALALSVTSAAKRGYVDQVVDAADTRKYVIGAFEMLFTKSEDRPAKKHGTV